MWQLPAVQIGDSAVHLPCSLDVLIKLSNIAIRPGVDSRQQQLIEFGNLFRYAPSLFLLAASSGRAVKDFEDWVLGGFVDMVAKQPLVPSTHEPARFRASRLKKSLNRVAASKKPGEYENGVSVFLSALRLGVGKRNRARFLESMKIKKNIKSFLQCTEPIDGEPLVNWLSPTVDVQQLLAAKAIIQELQSNADQKLQTAKLLAMKQLAYGASHEINNPLANIATRAQTLLADETHPERRQKLAVMYEQAMRAHEMISDLMLFGHPSAPRFELVDMDNLVRELIVEFRPDLRRHKIQINLATYPDLLPVMADRTQIADAIKALIRNSVESLTSQKSDRRAIQLRLWADGEGSVCVSVLDNGPGIICEAEPHLFDPFYSGREAGRGLGFGLSKAWTIVQRLHHGELNWLSHDSGFSTEFRIRLPIRQPAVTSVDSEQQPHAA